ncbi:hypothetical protein [Cryobacterium sp. CG_9.6]|uniref:hypothetical protein n=1 Tax=Cryobacterium sp. CG_9.6 TaxID=2760710 RepID=UPI0024755DD7|nr:hypothetical protein [Cryobacterium sp. CG_9.6]MDH6235836.1 hypothetical protein [Cryobacterium sp. CG_9.6]
MSQSSSRSHTVLTVTVIVGAALLGLLIFLALGAIQLEREVSADPASAAQTTFVGLPAPSGEPELASIAALTPRPGEVVRASGPFDDRFVVEDVLFTGDAVTGAIRVTSDVSAVLELEVLTGFYDESGTLLTTGRFVHHLDDNGDAHDGPPEESVQFSVPVPADSVGQAVSVSVGVPVLVNE